MARTGYARKSPAVMARRVRKKVTANTNAKASKQTVAKQTAPKEAHRMVDTADTHRTDGTVTGRNHRSYLGEVKPIANGEYGKPPKTVQHAWDTNYEADMFRKSGYTHLSDLMGKCHRMLAIIKRYDIHPSPKRLFDQSVVVFAQGNMLHDEARRRYANQIPEMFYGFWRCGCRETCEEGTKSSVSKSCKHCGGGLDEYVELRVIYDDIEVGHSMDGLLLHASGQLEVVEIKSCTKEAFEKYKTNQRPDMEHVTQAGAYWKALRVAGYDVTDTVSVVYVCKEYVTPSQSYTIQTPMNDVIVENNVDPLYDDMPIINELEFKAPLPPRMGSCVKCGTGGTKYCSVAALCFLLPESGEWYGAVEVKP